MQIFSFHLSAAELSILYLVAILIGMAKTGVHGAGMLSVPLLAAVFGGQRSTGLLLPILCFADVLGLWYYHRHASWKHLKLLFPWAAGGTVLGAIVGGQINENAFKGFMAIAIVGSVIIMVMLERRRDKVIPDSKALGSATGVAGGFTSMVGNLAGPLMAVYFLSMRLPKFIFIGTSAWFFLVMNFFKVPFHVFHWKTISRDTLLLDITTIPFIIAGAWAGIIIVKNISEKIYRWLIIIMTIIAAVVMVIR